MTRILAVDPSGTGTTGLFFKGEGWEQFCSHQGSEWKKHYEFIAGMVKVYHPDILLYEHTNFINLRGKDMTSLLKLLGTMETLSLACSVASPRIEAIPVNQVKELRSKLLKGETKITGLEYKKGKGWYHNQKKISVHCLDAYLVYWIWESKQNNELMGKSIESSKSKAKDKQNDYEKEIDDEEDEMVGGCWPPEGSPSCILMECRKCKTEYPLSMGHECPPKWEDDLTEETKEPDIKGSALVCEGCGHSRGLCICKPEDIDKEIDHE